MKAQSDQSRRCASGQAQGSGYRRRRRQHLDAHDAHREWPLVVCAFALPTGSCQAWRKQRQCRRGTSGLFTHNQPWRKADEIGSGQSGWLAIGGPHQPGDAGRFGFDSKGLCDLLGCTAAGHMETAAGDHCSHGVNVRVKAGHALQPDEVVGGAGTVELPVWEAPDQVAADQFFKRGFDLCRAGVEAARESALPGKAPAGLVVYEVGSDPVGKDRKRCSGWHRGVSTSDAVRVCARLGSPQLLAGRVVRGTSDTVARPGYASCSA